MKIQSFFMCLLAAASISSCKDDYENTVDVKEVNVTLCAFEDENTDTRSSYTNSTNGIEGVWAEGDILGIYPIGGDQVAFPISDGIGTSTAKFDGGSWALRPAIQYAAYYPFSADNYTISETEIPVSYLGQVQNGNGSLTHLSNYDYMASAATEPSANGSVNLVMKHLGSFAHLQFTMPSAGTYTSIDVKTDAGAFITKGHVDLSSATPSVSSVETSTSIHFKLNNVTLSNEDKVLKAYMLVAPVNLSTSTFTFTVTDSNGATYEATAAGKNFTANKNYMFRLSPSPTGTGGTMEGGGGFDEDITPYVTFTSEGTQSLTMSKAIETLEYSVNDGPWTELSSNTVTFGGTYGDLKLRGHSSFGTAISNDNYSTIQFGSSSLVSCNGDIRTLVDYENYATVNTQNVRFCSLFRNCTSLITSPALPATTLAVDCYFMMFKGCSSLTTAPTLPATTLASECYQGMFEGCSSLTTAPILPATTLATSNCYCGMFRDCTSLTSAPALPATILETSCYCQMFDGCFSLSNAPTLPATTLAAGCYDGMFRNCTSLSTAPALPAMTLALGCYQGMFRGCSSLISAPELPATTLAEYCYSGMFISCT